MLHPLFSTIFRFDREDNINHLFYRYLLAQKKVPEEDMHRVRVMFGNGLRAEIWPEFVRRYRIECIGEVYGSTEGNSSIGKLFPVYEMLLRNCYKQSFFCIFTCIQEDSSAVSA